MKPAVEVGQVYREKDKRMFGRCVKVLEIKGNRAECVRCSPSGEVSPGYFATHISLKNLQTRFTLVTGEHTTSHAAEVDKDGTVLVMCTCGWHDSVDVKGMGYVEGMSAIFKARDEHEASPEDKK